MKTITKRILFLVAVLLAVPMFIFAFSKGDLLIAQDSNSMARLPLGQDGQVLTVSSTAPLGMAWVTPTIPVKHFQVDTGKTLTTGLRAYYKLEDENDFWGMNNLTTYGGATFSAAKINFGVTTSPLAPSYLNVANNGGIDGGSISIAGWVRVANAPAVGGSMALFSQGSSISKTGYSVLYHNDGGVLKLFAFRGRGGIANTGPDIAETLVVGTWYHVVITYDGTNVKLYLNNNLLGSVADSGNGNDLTMVSHLNVTGGYPGYPSSYPWDGMTDEVGIWSRALSTTEIADLYNGGNGQTIMQ